MIFKLLIADDHVLFNDGVKTMLENELAIHVVGQVFSGGQVIEFVKVNKPDIILLDINMPDRSGMEVVSILSKAHPEIRVIMLTMYNDRHLIQECKRRNVAGYILKNASKEDLVNGIKSVLAGNSFYDPSLEYRNSSHQSDDFIKKYKLTKRELEIIHLVKENYTAQDIANRLFLSVFTVETHRKNINLKLGIRNAVSLVKFALEHNI